MPVNKNSATPLYQQLAALLADDISRGIYPPGSRLPSESELCHTHEVSRITVRQALNELTHRNLIQSQHGKGSFVAMPRINTHIQQIVRFATSLKQDGLGGHTMVLAFEKNAGDMKLGKSAARLDLLGLIQDIPAVLYRSFIRADIAEKMYREAKKLVQQKAAFSSLDLYDYLEVKPVRLEQIITAKLMNAELREYFGPAYNDALMVRESWYYDAKDELLEHKTGYYRADCYNFQLQRTL